MDKQAGPDAEGWHKAGDFFCIFSTAPSKGC